MSSPRAIRALLVALAVLGGLGLRSAFNYPAVFRGGDVVFEDPDASFHVRTIENLVHHFPHRSGFDPYSAFPHGQNVDTGPFFDYAVGAVAWIAGFGAPSRHLTDLVAAWFPALLGALVAIPVYFLGCELFEPAAGLVASGLIAILPGSFLFVSRLGNPDHHVAEALLSTLLLLLLVKSLKADSPRWFVPLAGLVLGCYLTTRAAGAFLVLFVEIWAMVQICSNHLRGGNNRRVWWVTVPALFTGWVILVIAGPTVWSHITSLVLWGGMVSISVAVAVSEAVHSRLLFLAVLTGALAAGIAITAFLRPELLKAALASVTDRLSPTAQTVGELRPLLTATGSLSLAPAWDQFTTCWFLAPIALLYVGWRALKANSPAHLLFAIWSALMLAASFQQLRNCYYLAVNIALLTGFAFTQLTRSPRRYERIVTCLLLGAALTIPNASAAYRLVNADSTLTEDWRGALAFLRSQTPEPFRDPSVFDGYFPRLAPAAVFQYPESAWGVMNWWDFGHWISAYGHRIPIANGMQAGAAEAARFFTATDPGEAAQILRRNGARYVVADASMPLHPGGGSFLPMLSWAGLDAGKFVEVYESHGLPVTVFYPAWYESMLARLYLFDGQPQTPRSSTWVFEFAGGEKPRRIVSQRAFDSYGEAQAYVKEHASPNIVIGGLNPMQSCVPLSRLGGYRLAYNSQPLQAVKVFEYTP